MFRSVTPAVCDKEAAGANAPAVSRVRIVGPGEPPQISGTGWGGGGPT